jgi:hypothetical protein
MEVLEVTTVAADEAVGAMEVAAVEAAVGAAHEGSVVAAVEAAHEGGVAPLGEGSLVEVEVEEPSGAIVWQPARVLATLDGGGFRACINGDVDFIEAFTAADEGVEWRRVPAEGEAAAAAAIAAAVEGRRVRRERLESMQGEHRRMEEELLELMRRKRELETRILEEQLAQGNEALMGPAADSDDEASPPTVGME